MKLKNVLVLAFLTLTLIPTILIAFLLYRSGFNLAKESYTRNLVESINVQSDYIAQALQDDMITNYRFASRNFALLSELNSSALQHKAELLGAMQNYLQTSEDKIAVCILLNKKNEPLYTIGERHVIDAIRRQLPNTTNLDGQLIMEFELDKKASSLGIVTPVHDAAGTYLGCIVAVYDQSYIFKIISSYYKIANTSTYLCNDRGNIINFRQPSGGAHNTAIEKALNNLHFSTEGSIDITTDSQPLSGYYKNISNTSWYLVGFINHNLISTFTKQFITIYIAIILAVLLAGVVLSFYFSGKVVEPINGLIKVMERYQTTLDVNELQFEIKHSYFEIQYLRSQFTSLMRTILLVRHNFEGMYQLYQSSDLGDTNIDIDVKNQTAVSNKPAFQQLMDEAKVDVGACVVENFVSCFCENDQKILMSMMENMRDEHLAVTRKAEVFTPHLNKKWFHVLVVPIYENESLSRLFIQLRDISSFKKKEMESLEQARRDALTGLYNRIGFSANVNKAAKAAHEKNPSAMHGLLFIDMNFFKLVNDNFGHSTGDTLLCAVATNLLELAGPDGIVSRFGGDEFAIFLPNTTEEKIAQLVTLIKKSLGYPFHSDTIDFTVSASIGTAMWTPASPVTLDQLVEQADSAMYQAKRQFKQETAPAAEA